MPLWLILVIVGAMASHLGCIGLFCIACDGYLAVDGNVYVGCLPRMASLPWIAQCQNKIASPYLAALSPSSLGLPTSARMAKPCGG